MYHIIQKKYFFCFLIKHKQFIVLFKSLKKKMKKKKKEKSYNQNIFCIKHPFHRPPIYVHNRNTLARSLVRSIEIKQ